MTFDPVKDIEDFHKQFGIEYSGPPRQLPKDLAKFRYEFLWEELDEYEEAVHTKDIEKQLDALIDLMYVTIGTLHLHGFDAREAWHRVHEANMKKVKAKRDEESTRGSGAFDVVKPPGWQPASLADLVSPDYKRPYEFEGGLEALTPNEDQ